MLSFITMRLFIETYERNFLDVFPKIYIFLRLCSNDAARYLVRMARIKKTNKWFILLFTWLVANIPHFTL